MTCPAQGQIFKDCGGSCERTCNDILSQKPFVCSKHYCIPGCACPAGQVIILFLLLTLFSHSLFYNFIRYWMKQIINVFIQSNVLVKDHVTQCLKIVLESIMTTAIVHHVEVGIIQLLALNSLYCVVRKII